MTGDEQVELRTVTSGGICDRTYTAAQIPTEVDFQRSTGKCRAMYLRAVGADEWRKIG